MKNKRLLFITPIFPKDITQDYVVPFIYQFTDAFSNYTNIQIDVISLMYPFTNEQYQIKNITIYPIGSNFVKPIKQIPYFLKAISKGITLCKKNKYDGILCFWHREAALIGTILSKIFGLKLRVWFHGQDVKKSNKYISLLRLHPKKMIMISAQQRNFFYKDHNIKVATIANVSINKNLFPKLNLEERTIDVLGVGNIGSLKNYTLFVDIIALLQKEFPEINTIICGDDGGEKKALEEKIKHLNLTKNITLVGQKHHNEVLKYMNNTTIFLHTSKFEGAGTVLHEALYSGCKVVSTIEIEDTEEINEFYYSKNLIELKDKIHEFLNSKSTSKRIEKFKIEDTIKVIYDSFYI